MSDTTNLPRFERGWLCFGTPEQPRAVLLAGRRHQHAPKPATVEAVLRHLCRERDGLPRKGSFAWSGLARAVYKGKTICLNVVGGKPEDVAAFGASFPAHA